MNRVLQNDFFVFVAGVWLILSALGCFALNIFKYFNWTVLSFVVFLSCCSSSNVVLAGKFWQVLIFTNILELKYKIMYYHHPICGHFIYYGTSGREFIPHKISWNGKLIDYDVWTFGRFGWQYAGRYSACGKMYHHILHLCVDVNQ